MLWKLLWRNIAATPEQLQSNSGGTWQTRRRMSAILYGQRLRSIVGAALEQLRSSCGQTTSQRIGNSTPAGGGNVGATPDRLRWDSATSAGDDCRRSCTVDSRLMSSFVWLGYVNSALNPVIYTIFNADFRRAFRRLLHQPCSAVTHSY